MATDKEYKQIAERVYDVDSGKIKNPVIKDAIVADGKFHVLRVEDNHSNGMQTMAIVPFMNKEIFYLNKRIFISVFFC